MRSIEERTRFLQAVKFDFEQRQQIEDILKWIIDDPETAAQYIVWLQDINEQN